MIESSWFLLKLNCENRVQISNFWIRVEFFFWATYLSEVLDENYDRAIIRSSNSSSQQKQNISYWFQSSTILLDEDDDICYFAPVWITQA